MIRQLQGMLRREGPLQFLFASEARQPLYGTPCDRRPGHSTPAAHLRNRGWPGFSPRATAYIKVATIRVALLCCAVEADQRLVGRAAHSGPRRTVRALAPRRRGMKDKVATTHVWDDSSGSAQPLRWLQRFTDDRLPPLADVALASSALAELRHGDRSIAFSSKRDDERDLYLIGAQGGTERQLTSTATAMHLIEGALICGK